MRASVIGLGVTVMFSVVACAGSDKVGEQASGFGVAPPAAGISGAGAGGAAGGTPPLAGAAGGAGTISGAAGTAGAAGMSGTAGAGTGGMSGAGAGAGGMAMAGTSGGAGSGEPMAGSGEPPMIGDAEPRIPPMPASCPEIRTGNITVKGQSVKLWVGPADKTGPMVFYWHGTGSTADEASGGLGPGLRDVETNGGVVASFTTTTRSGMNTGNNVWYTGDFEMADEIFACAHAKGLVDPRQVFTAGCSAGGLQASAMVYGRSSYLAAAMPNSGGTVFRYMLEDDHVPAVITAHGAPGSDVVIIDFSETSATQCADIASKGGFMINCNHGAGHCRSPADLKAAQWQFMKDHPFGVDPEPYASGLPAGMPDYCEVCE
jgi:hypothetical protein